MAVAVAVAVAVAQAMVAAAMVVRAMVVVVVVVVAMAVAPVEAAEVLPRVVVISTKCHQSCSIANGPEDRRPVQDLRYNTSMDYTYGSKLAIVARVRVLWHQEG